MQHPIELERLIEAARQGDRASFDRVFDAWFALVYGLTLQRVRGDRERAEALTDRRMERSLRLALTQPSGGTHLTESTIAAAKGAVAG